MNMSNNAEEERGLGSQPPSSRGMARKSPTTGLSGRVSIKANQKRWF